MMNGWAQKILKRRLRQKVLIIVFLGGMWPFSMVNAAQMPLIEQWLTLLTKIGMEQTLREDDNPSPNYQTCIRAILNEQVLPLATQNAVQGVRQTEQGNQALNAVNQLFDTPAERTRLKNQQHIIHTYLAQGQIERADAAWMDYTGSFIERAPDRIRPEFARVLNALEFDSMLQQLDYPQLLANEPACRAYMQDIENTTS